MKHQYMEMKLLKIQQKKVNSERSTSMILNRIRKKCGEVKCGSCLFKWGIIESLCCDCGALDQTLSYELFLIIKKKKE